MTKLVGVKMQCRSEGYNIKSAADDDVAMASSNSPSLSRISDILMHGMDGKWVLGGFGVDTLMGAGQGGGVAWGQRC